MRPGSRVRPDRFGGDGRPRRRRSAAVTFGAVEVVRGTSWGGRTGRGVVPPGPGQPGGEAAGGRGVGVVFPAPAQGKVDAWLRVTRRAGDELVLDVDGGFGEAVASSGSSASCCAQRPTLERGTWTGWPCVARARRGHQGGRRLAVAWPGVDGIRRAGTRAAPRCRRRRGPRRAPSRRCASSAACPPWAPRSPTPRSRPSRVSG